MKRHRVQAQHYDRTHAPTIGPGGGVRPAAGPATTRVMGEDRTVAVFQQRQRDDPNFDLLRDQARQVDDSPVVMQSRQVGEGVVRRPYVGLPRSARPNGLGEPNGRAPIIYHSTEDPERGP